MPSIISATDNTTSCAKPPKISFKQGNNVKVLMQDSCCPITVSVKCEHLVLNQKYTINLTNMGIADARIFPRSISFVATDTTQEFDFFVQFICDNNNTAPLANTRYLLQINKAASIDINSLNISLLNCTIGGVKVKDNQYVIKKYANFIEISFDNSLLPNSQHYLDFTICIDNPNIISTTRQISISSLGLMVDMIDLLDVNSIEDDIGITTTTISQTSSGTASATTITVPSTTNKIEQATIIVPQGAVFYDSSGKIITGNLKAVAAHFSPLHTNSLNKFVSPLFVNKATNINQQAINNHFYLYSIGLVSLEIVNSNNTKAYSCSKNISVNIQLNNSNLNPANSFANINNGDIITVWNIDNKGILRAQQTCAVSVDNAEQKYISFNTKNINTYNLAWRLDSCSFLEIDLSKYISINKKQLINIDMSTDPTAIPNSSSISFRLNAASVRQALCVLADYPNYPVRLKIYSDIDRSELLTELRVLSCGDQPEIIVD